MHPLDEIIGRLPVLDFAVLQHQFARHGRDYIVFIENNITADSGQHEITFTHCVKAVLETRVKGEIWTKSWADNFTDFEEWTKAGEPEGYVWGTNWSLAYPGIKAVYDSAEAAAWSKRLGKEMFEASLETDRFILRLIFHSIRSRKVSEEIGTISASVFPLRWCD